MATAVQRFGTIVDALIDGAASAALKTQVADAIVVRQRDWILRFVDGDGVPLYDPDALTAEQKAKVSLIFIKDQLKGLVLQNDSGLADAVVAQKAANASAEIAYKTALSAVQAGVDSALVSESL